MSAYTALSDMFEVADEFGEARVLRDVAHRAGWLWVCTNERCGRDNIGRNDPCEHCGVPAPEPDPPAAQWWCVCGAVTVSDVCVCNRTRPHFRRS